jgi:hypothetical protein
VPAIALLFSLLLGEGCEHSLRDIPVVDVHSVPMPALPPASRPVPVSPQVRRGPIRMAPGIDLEWFKSSGLIPPGARRIQSKTPVVLTLVDTQRGTYPSTEICAAPNDQWILRCGEISIQHRMTHVLTAFENHSPDSISLYSTNYSFDTLWSPEGKFIALTEYNGDNKSDIMVFNITNLMKSGAIDLRPALEPYFSESQLTWPRFQRTYQWSNLGLVVRGIARNFTEPFDQFGYEVLLKFDNLTTTTEMVFLRGYVKQEKL